MEHAYWQGMGIVHEHHQRGLLQHDDGDKKMEKCSIFMELIRVNILEIYELSPSKQGRSVTLCEWKLLLEQMLNFAQIAVRDCIAKHRYQCC